MTIKGKKSKSTIAEEKADLLLTELLSGQAKVMLFTQAFVRNQIRFNRRERIAPPTPSAPDPDLAALEYQHRELTDLVTHLNVMIITAHLLKTQNREAYTARVKVRRIA